MEVSTSGLRCPRPRGQALAGVYAGLGDRAASEGSSGPDGNSLNLGLPYWHTNAEAEAGLPKTGCVHRLRHTFCSALAALGVSEHVMKELAGHSDLGATFRYLHLRDGAAKDAVKLLK